MNNEFEMSGEKYREFETIEGAQRWCARNPGFEPSVKKSRRGKVLTQRFYAVPVEKLKAKRTAPKEATARISQTLDQLLENPTKPRWLIRDQLERGVIAVMAGPRGSYKTTAVTHWIGQTLLAGDPVLWLHGEGGNADRLIQAWLTLHAPEVSTASLPLYIVQRRYDLFQSDIATVRAECEAIKQERGKLSLIVVDTVSKFSGALRENDNDDAKLFVGQLDRHLRSPFDASVLLVGHTGLSDTGRVRGASALTADTEAEYIVSRRPGGVVSITRERFKASPELPPLVLRTEPVELGRVDDYGRPVTALAIAGEVDAKEQAIAFKKAPKLGANEEKVLACVRAAGGRMTNEAIREELKKTIPRKEGTRDNRKRDIDRAIGSLADKGLLFVVPGSDGLEVELPERRCLPDSPIDPFDLPRK